MTTNQCRMPYLLSTYASGDKVVIQCENEERAAAAWRLVMNWLHELHEEETHQAKLAALSDTDALRIARGLLSDEAK